MTSSEKQRLRKTSHARSQVPGRHEEATLRNRVLPDKLTVAQQLDKKLRAGRGWRKPRHAKDEVTRRSILYPSNITRQRLRNFAIENPNRVFSNLFLLGVFPASNFSDVRSDLRVYDARSRAVGTPDSYLGSCLSQDFVVFLSASNMATASRLALVCTGDAQTLSVCFCACALRFEAQQTMKRWTKEQKNIRKIIINIKNKYLY